MLRHPATAGLLCVLLLLVGCGGPKMDTTNDQTLRDSMAVMTKGMSKQNENKFRMACNTVAAAKGGGAAADGDQSEATKLKPLNGMTKEQIESTAASILDENKKRRK